jgi:hypothetical protein
MKFGKVVSTPSFFQMPEIELSDPPIYSPDGFIQSKDGMCWVRAAPDAAAPAVPSGAYRTSFATANINIGGCAPAPGPYPYLMIGGPKS